MSEILWWKVINRRTLAFFTAGEKLVQQIEKHYPSVLKTNVDFQNELDQLDDLCTNDKDGGMETIIIDENSVCQYTSERKNDIGLCANALSDKIFNLEILVNRA